MSAEERPTLFLNLDGVAHRAEMAYLLPMGISGPGVPKPFEWVGALQPVVEELNADVVLRTSATMVLGFEKVKAIAPDWLKARIVGATGDTIVWLTLYESRKLNSSCGVVRNYVKTHCLRWWAALDDDDEGWQYDKVMRAPGEVRPGNGSVRP
ncbi:HAD domain-containing protein [Roseateles chitosanitabidus]|uniref:HAD domain-containing protein n=1 Tax=Roseateles chitosanitabidus TaxID=65048 RepID=UPI00082F66BC|nr:HAD domain-containing protein [Roseateles chitosanitabidus]